MTSDASPTGLRLWVAGARPRTLPAAVVPVVVGTAAVADADLGDGRGLVAWRFLAALAVSLCLQVAVNYANDYSDGVRGTDDERRVGPQRLVGSGLVAPGPVKRAAVLFLGLAGAIGLALAAAAGWELLIVGAASMAAAWFYTGGSKPYGYLGLGEVFVFVFFGLVATVGSAYVQVESIRGVALAAAVPVGLVATALLVVNNLRDIPGDTLVGKRTLAVRLGDDRTRYLYVLLVVGAVVAGAAIAIDRGPWLLLSMGALAVARTPMRAVLRGATGPELIPVLGATGRTQLALGALLSAGLWLSS
ncbi:MAG: 1,4-dihydroxy-2-naphthoate polyprenyltransferase [Acidimicrobiia bacterium]|nr:1,4-dihydroxy-2-naphthoate polyprenyltransferase [Acidimicrobiia bacterium]